MAIRLGSARMVAWFWVARKSIRVFRLSSRVANCRAPVETAPPVGEMVLTAKPRRKLPVPNRAMLLMFCQLMPTRFRASRLTSATLTRSCTWVGASIADVADHLVGVAVDLLQGEPARILGDDGRAHGAGQHDRLALVVEDDAVAGMDAVERALDAAERRGHAHDGVEQHAVLGVDGIEHGVARLLGEDVDHGGRAHLDVGDVGRGHEHRGGRARQLERRALVDLERQRRRLGRHDLALAERPARRTAGTTGAGWLGVPAAGGWIGTGAARRRRRRRRRLRRTRRRAGGGDGVRPGWPRSTPGVSEASRSARAAGWRRRSAAANRRRTEFRPAWLRPARLSPAAARRGRRRGHGGRRAHRPHGLCGALGLAAVEIVRDVVGRGLARRRLLGRRRRLGLGPDPVGVAHLDLRQQQRRLEGEGSDAASASDEPTRRQAEGGSQGE